MATMTQKKHHGFLKALLILLLIGAIVVGGYFIYKKVRKLLPDALRDKREVDASVSEDGILSIYDRDDETSKVWYFSILGQQKTEFYYSSYDAAGFKKDREGYYGADFDLKTYGTFDTDSVYEIDIEFYWAEFGSLFLGNGSKTYVQKINNLNQRHRIYFVCDENGKFYDPNTYYNGKVQSITTLYPIPSVFMQYSSAPQSDNLMILNLHDGTTREAELPYQITNQIDTSEPGNKKITFEYCGVTYEHEYKVLPADIDTSARTVTGVDASEADEITICSPTKNGSAYTLAEGILPSLKHVKKLTYGYDLAENALQGFDNIEELTVKAGSVPLQTVFGGSIPATLKTVRLLSGSQKLSAYYFHGAGSVENIFIPASVTETEDNAFEGLKDDLTTLTISGNITVPKNFTTETVRVAPGSGTVCQFFLYNNTNVKTLIMPNSVTEIGVNALANSALTDIRFSNRLTSLLRDSFTGIKGITELRLPESATYFAPSVFSNMTNLTAIYLGKSVKTIEGSLFIGDTSLTIFSCPSPNAKISLSGLLHDTKVRELHISGQQPIVFIYWQKGDTTDIFPLVDLYVYGDICDNFAKNMKHNLHSVYLRLDPSVTKIGNNAFEGTNIFKSLELKNITSIGTEAFKNSRFDTFFEGGHLETIGDDAFVSSDYMNGKSKVVLDGILLKQFPDADGKVIVDEGVRAIAGYAFGSGTKEVVLPASVQSVTGTSFSSDTLTKITLNGRLTISGGGNPFGGTTALSEIYVPLAMIEYYRTTDGWKHAASLYTPL